MSQSKTFPRPVIVNHRRNSNNNNNDDDDDDNNNNNNHNNITINNNKTTTMQTTGRLSLSSTTTTTTTTTNTTIISSTSNRMKMRMIIEIQEKPKYAKEVMLCIVISCLVTIQFFFLSPPSYSFFLLSASSLSSSSPSLSLSSQTVAMKEKLNNHYRHDNEIPTTAAITVSATTTTSSSCCSSSSSSLQKKFSWRVCFFANHSSSSGGNKSEEEGRNSCSKCCRDSVEEWNKEEEAFKTTTATNNNNNNNNDEWIPDVTILKRMYLNGHDSNGNPWPPPLDDELCESIGVNGGDDDDWNKLVFQEIPLHAAPFHPDTITTTTTTNDNDKTTITKKSTTNTFSSTRTSTPKLLCMIYTMEHAHPTRVRAIRETWASGCDGFLAFSTKTDPRIPAISIPHEGPEEYENMWQKVRSIWKFAFRHYLDDFDFFHLGGDDMYVLPQNLKNYLSNLVVQTKNNVTQQQQQQSSSASSSSITISFDNIPPLFIGRRLKAFHGWQKDIVFNTGGPGYVLSRSALQQFISVMDDHIECDQDRRTPSEDVMIAKCLLRALNITTIDTRDEQQRERFHYYSPFLLYFGQTPKWYQAMDQMEWGGNKVGKDCCASDLVAFHHIQDPAMMRHIHKLLVDKETCQSYM